MVASYPKGSSGQMANAQKKAPQNGAFNNKIQVN
jgi:hypothetical protein